MNPADAEISAFMWAVIFPDGEICTGSDMKNEADAWEIALGWPDAQEIEDAKKSGVYAAKARLLYWVRK
jgi:hypothetical protein